MARSSQIKVLSSLAFKEAYLELVPQFEKASAHRVATTWTGTANIMKRMAAGEAYDLVIMSAQGIDELSRTGKIAPGSRVDLARSGIGLAVRTGAPKPDVGSTDALKQTLLSAKSIGYSTGPSGAYMENLFKRLGIADDIKGKLKQVPTGTPVGKIVASGEADVGFQQVSELILHPGIDYVGPLPAGVQHITVFAAGIHTGANEAEAARALVEFFTAPGAVPVIKQKGLEPGGS